MIRFGRKEKGSQNHRGEGSTEHLLLALIAQGPRYGFEMIRELDELGLSRVREEGSIYPVLSRLENQGLVESFRTVEGAEGRRRKYYRMLPEGIRRLEDYDRRWREYRAAVDSLIETSAR